MNELTYILGAGASYQSIPVVKTFPKRFDVFVRSMENYLLGIESVNKEVLAEFLKELKTFGNEIKSHQSFDTYFKKLFHIEGESKIRKAKKILNLYFLWEHFQPAVGSADYYEFTDPFGNDIVEKKDENTFIKQSLIDKRYDALIAGLIKPLKNEIDFFSKINFISWNYDLNLLYSIKNFIDNSKTINDVIENICDMGNKNIWQLHKDCKIINMNGFFYSSKLENTSSFSNTYFFSIIDKLFKNGPFSIEDKVLDEDANRINFAWEKSLDFNENTTLKEAKNAIEKSDKIVVIGYTFPLYNRLVDLKYFNLKNLNRKTLYIQDPDADEIVKSVKANFSIPEGKNGFSDSSYVNIEAIKNCDSFFVPNNIFKQ